jgi:putative transposase
LAMLNEATQAWAEFDHNRKIHSEIGEAPITRFLPRARSIRDRLAAAT